MTARIHALRPEMKRLRSEGKTLKEIASTLDIGVTTVRNNLIAAGSYAPLRRQSPGWTEEEDATLIQGRKDGLTGRALTALFPDRAHGTVLNRLHALRNTFKRDVFKGDQRIVR